MSDATVTATAFEAGRLACRAGAPREANPYIEGTADHLAWDKGWDEEATRLAEQEP